MQLRQLLPLFLLCAGISHAVAQDEPAQDEPEVFQALSFYYIAPDEVEDDLTIQLKIGEEMSRRTLTPRFKEDPVFRPARAGLRIFRPSPPDVPPTLIGDADFPASWSSILILVSKTDSGQLRVFPYNTSLSEIPEGTVGFYNFSKKEVAYKIGEDRGTIEPLSLQNYTVTTPPNSTNTLEVLNLSLEKDGKWESVFRRRVILDKVKRSFVMITPGTRRDLDILQFDIPEEPILGMDP